MGEEIFLPILTDIIYFFNLTWTQFLTPEFVEGDFLNFIYKNNNNPINSFRNWIYRERKGVVYSTTSVIGTNWDHLRIVMIYLLFQERYL